MKKYYKIVPWIFLLLISVNANARPCNQYEYDKAEYLAQEAGKKVVSKSYGGGTNVEVDIKSCAYNSYTEKFDLGIDMYWNGWARKNRLYNVEGSMKFSSFGSSIKFSETYANRALRKHRFWMGVGAVTVVVGAVVLSDD